MAEKLSVMDILEKENETLDRLLDVQSNVHIAVKTRNWIGLEDDLEKIRVLSLEFSALEEKREAASSNEIKPDEKALMLKLHSKLLRSKIENQILNKYIETSRGFVQGILENAVPQRRNIVYTRNGKVLKREPESVVLNRIF
ncbi:MAG: hypothetical protein IJL24_03440 [Treponema sp.]|jgi:phosphoenolpyruvate synthase/pyruvate phosphate dikinase|nr:hypothetical protein [Treponema sp.]